MGWVDSVVALAGSYVDTPSSESCDAIVSNLHSVVFVVVVSALSRFLESVATTAGTNHRGDPCSQFHLEVVLNRDHRHRRLRRLQAQAQAQAQEAGGDTLYTSSIYRIVPIETAFHLRHARHPGACVGATLRQLAQCRAVNTPSYFAIHSPKGPIPDQLNPACMRVGIASPTRRNS